MKNLTATLELEPRSEDSLGGGFVIEHVTAENDEVVAGIDSGAGMGNPLVSFWIEPKKGKNGKKLRKRKRAYYDVDMREVLRDLIDKALDSTKG